MRSDEAEQLCSIINIMKNRRPVGVFDSGVGGLSVLKELHKLLPKEDFIFVADQAHVPYGEKSPSELCRLTASLSDFLIKQGVKLIVVACNTATCYAIEHLRKEFPTIPFVGTVPAIKTAAGQTVQKRIGIISTPATSESSYLAELISGYAQGVRVINIGCAGLENVIEKGALNSKETSSLLKKYLKPIKTASADALVLGCTHYPFLRDKIAQNMGPEVTIFDSGKAIAQQTSALLKKSSSLNTLGGTSYYFTTGNTDNFSKVGSILMNKNISVSHVSL